MEWLVDTAMEWLVDTAIGTWHIYTNTKRLPYFVEKYKFKLIIQSTKHIIIKMLLVCQAFRTF